MAAAGGLAGSVVRDLLPGIGERLTAYSQAVTDMAQQLRDTMAAVASTAARTPAVTPSAAPAAISPSPKRHRAAPISEPSAEPVGGEPDKTPLRAGARRMLTALASHHPARITRTQLATLTRMKPSSGTYSTYLSDLRRHHYVEKCDGALTITAAGRAAANAGVPDAPMTAEQVREQWLGVLRAGARRMLDTLITTYPHPITRAELAAAADLAPSSGTFTTYLSDLRRNCLATETAEGLAAADVLFLTPTPDRG